jgi:hypothetical protein
MKNKPGNGCEVNSCRLGSLVFERTKLEVSDDASLRLLSLVTSSKEEINNYFYIYVKSEMKSDWSKIEWTGVVKITKAQALALFNCTLQ